MIKQIKDLTLDEIKKICNDCELGCRKEGKRCPLFHTTISCDQIVNIINAALRHNKNAMEEKIEIKGDEYE